jgi:molecular chaperone GrpE
MSKPKSKKGEPSTARDAETDKATAPQAETPQTEAAEAEAPADGGAEPKSEEARLQVQVTELKDHLLRALAETENLRRRAERDREETAKYAIAGFARDMVAIADDLVRALGSVPAELGDGDEHIRPMLDGIEITQRALEAALDRHGITRIDPLDEKFDHNLHEAMFEVEVADKEPGTVVQVVQRGYRIHDRLLRPARVGVAKRPAAGAADTEA